MYEEIYFDFRGGRFLLTRNLMTGDVTLDQLLADGRMADLNLDAIPDALRTAMNTAWSHGSKGKDA